MPEPIQISPILNRAIVRLKSWVVPPTTPPQRGGDEFLFFFESEVTAKPSAMPPVAPHPTRAQSPLWVDAGAPPPPLGGEDRSLCDEEERSQPAPGLERLRCLIPPELTGQANVLHLGPGEWLIVSDALEGAALHAQLAQYLEGESIALVDLSCALKALRIEGPCARELLSKGCALDLHPNSFTAGHSSRTRFGQLSVILHCTDTAPRFDLYVARSSVPYLQSRLRDSAREFFAGQCVSQD